MARPLRINLAGGRYHVTARGNERRRIFRDDRDRRHLLDLLAALPERFGLGLQAWVFMDNHYHLLVETPEANLSQAVQWLNVAYSVWFNRRHQRSGHLFQGRFGSVLIGGDRQWQEVARYVHLNPVRVAGLGLGKVDRQRQGSPAARDPGTEVVAERLRVLRNYRWSSYRAYSGQERVAEWLTTEIVLGLCGGRTEAERRRAFREYHEAPLQEGRLESVWSRLVAGAVLGSESFVAGLRQHWKVRSSEEARSGQWSPRMGWNQIVKAVETVHGGHWQEFRDQHGDWGRDLALYLGRRQGRLKLRELALWAGGIGYTAVAQAVSRVARQVERGGACRQRLDKAIVELSKLKM
ncbi:MAG: transposase [Verrucomicrobia bacterium]|nr:transposase [Verrucomicrobiota bacterium]